MHEFEDLVEESVKVLAASERANQLDLRSMFWRLYDFQNHWDTGFTHFRVMDLLLQFRFVYRFDLKQHPDYEQYRTYFDSLTDFAFIHVDPLEPHGKNFFTPEKGWQLPNPVAGYTRPPDLYCNAGSPMWKRFIEAGILTGKDTLPPDEQISLIDTAKEVMLEAEKQNAFTMIAAWYSLLSVHVGSFTSNLDSLVGNAALDEVLAVVRRTNSVEKALDIQPLIRYGFTFPPLMNDIPSYIAYLKQMRGAMNDPNL